MLMNFNLYAQPQGLDLAGYSKEMNKSLPEVYDHATKLLRSSVENQNFSYHFLLRATKAEYDQALPHVKRQILKSVCTNSRDKIILHKYQANIVYRYENEKGQSLGEFMVSPSFCKPN